LAPGHSGSRLLRQCQAILSAQKNVADAEKNPWLWNALGVAQLNLKEYQQAKISFGEAKKSAEKLTSDDWRRAYPGNDPQSAESGLTAFREAIAANIQAVEKHLY